MGLIIIFSENDRRIPAHSKRSFSLFPQGRIDLSVAQQKGSSDHLRGGHPLHLFLKIKDPLIAKRAKVCGKAHASSLPARSHLAALPSGHQIRCG